MTLRYIAIIALIGGLGLWLNRALTPETPAESAYRLMGQAGIKHDLSEQDTLRLCQLIRSTDPEIVRLALGVAMILTKASDEEKAAIIGSARTVTWTPGDPCDLEYATNRAIGRLSK